MNRNNIGASTNVTQIFLDIVFMLLAALLAFLFTHEMFHEEDGLYILALLSLFVTLYVLSNKDARIYNITFFFYFDRFVKIITRSWIVATLFCSFLLLSFNASTSLKIFFYVFIFMAYIMIFINMIFSYFLRRLCSTYQAPRVAYVGYYEEYQKFTYYMNKTSIRCEQVGYILLDDCDVESHDGIVNVLGKLTELEEIIRKYHLDQVFFMQKSEERLSDIQEYVEVCCDMGVTVKIVIDSLMHRRIGSYVSSVGTYPVITYHTVSLNSFETVIKRLADIVISIVAIIIASPLMLFAAIAIKLESPGPIIFKQTRVGQNGRHFQIYKFRSMYENAEEEKKKLEQLNEMQGGFMFKMKDDPRVTNVGKFIRKTSIDELPQLFNVLMGSMSLVGTRPPTLDEVEKYERQHWRRISIKPGITGMWQVSGRNNITDFEDVVELDLYYIDHWNLLLDLKILFKTAYVLLIRKGAY